MISNYLRVAFRNLLKNKSYSAINIGGLSVGIGVAMLVALWMKDELSYNKYHENYSRIAQVMQHSLSGDEVYTIIYLPPVMGEELRTNYGGDFKRVVMSTINFPHVLSHGEEKFTRTGNYMEPEGPALMGLKMIYGTRELTDPYSILISQSIAKAFFGNEDPIGKVLRYDNIHDLKISGVYEDIPSNSDFKDIQFITAWELFMIIEPGIRSMENPWLAWNWQAFVELQDNADMAQVSEKIQDITAKKLPADLAASVKPKVFLHPMSNWHLYGEFKNGKNTGGQIEFVWLFGIIGIFVLVLACINFINLATARFQKRAREVGIRKVIGSFRHQLVAQFFIESQLLVIIAFILSVALVWLSMPFFNDLSGKNMTVPWTDAVFWLVSIGFIILTGLMAGLYPAVYLSSFQPVQVLKGTFVSGRLAIFSRKGLAVLQFTVSIALIIGTVIIFRQIQFAKDRPIGYTQSGLITIPMKPDIQKNITAIRSELLQSGVAVEVATSENSTIDYNVSDYRFDWKGKEPSVTVEFPISNVSYEYGKTIGWQILQGRDFSPEFVSDSSAFILNEAAVQTMGLKEPIGEQVTWDGKPFTVIGVVKNIIFESPYRAVRAAIFHMSNKQSYVVTVKMNPEKGESQALSEIGNTFRKYNPSMPFEFKFVDEEYGRKFGNEERIRKLASFFSVLAIFISCLGIFGMSAFIAEQRTKEMGIRKILGSSVVSIWGLLCRDFLVLVTVAFLVAAPLSYFVMSDWLQQFEYRTTVSWITILLVGVVSLLITLFTVSFQALKAALINPVKSLRSE